MRDAFGLFRGWCRSAPSCLEYTPTSVPTGAAEIAPLTGPMYQLFLLFMITDPATTVRSKRARIVVAVLIAMADTGIRLIDELPTTTPFHALLEAPPIFALAIVGPIAKWWDLRRDG